MESGPLAQPETVKRAGNREKAASQWSTLKSGPLAGSEAGEKARKLGRSRELVAHFKEWTTSSIRNREKGPKTREKPETLPKKKAAGIAGRF